MGLIIRKQTLCRPAWLCFVLLRNAIRNGAALLSGLSECQECIHGAMHLGHRGQIPLARSVVSHTSALCQTPHLFPPAISSCTRMQRRILLHVKVVVLRPTVRVLSVVVVSFCWKKYDISVRVHPGCEPQSRKWEDSWHSFKTSKSALRSSYRGSSHALKVRSVTHNVTWTHSVATPKAAEGLGSPSF